MVSGTDCNCWKLLRFAPGTHSIPMYLGTFFSATFQSLNFPFSHHLGGRPRQSVRPVVQCPVKRREKESCLSFSSKSQAAALCGSSRIGAVCLPSVMYTQRKRERETSASAQWSVVDRHSIGPSRLLVTNTWQLPTTTTAAASTATAPALSTRTHSEKCHQRRSEVSIHTLTAHNSRNSSSSHHWQDHKSPKQQPHQFDNCRWIADNGGDVKRLQTPTEWEKEKKERKHRLNQCPGNANTYTVELDNSFERRRKERERYAREDNKE